MQHVTTTLHESLLLMIHSSHGNSSSVCCLSMQNRNMVKSKVANSQPILVSISSWPHETLSSVLTFENKCDDHNQWQNLSTNNDKNTQVRFGDYGIHKWQTQSNNPHRHRFIAKAFVAAKLEANCYCKTKPYGTYNQTDFGRVLTSLGSSNEKFPR